MPASKSAAQAAEKWARVAPTRQTDFEAGVKDTTKDWAALTAAQAPAYEAGVTEAIQSGRFQKAVTKAGTPAWRDATITIGAPRWAGGIRASQNKYAEKMQPVIDVITRTTLGPRGPRGDPRNYQRAEAMGRALAEARRRG